MIKCKSIINLHDKSKLECHKYASDPIKFIIDHIHLQRKDASYIYLFDGSKYLSVRNERNNVIKRLNDPMEFAILWHSAGGKMDRDYDTIIENLKDINLRYFGSKYPIDKAKYKIFLDNLSSEYNKSPHKYRLTDVINANITLVKNPTSSMDMESAIAVIYYLLMSDVVGTMIAIGSINKV